MIIKIHSDIVNKIVERRTDLSEEIAFHNLIQAHLTNKHIIYFNRRDIIKLLDSNILNGSIKVNVK